MHGHPGTHSLARHDFNFAFVLRDRSMDDGQPQSTPFGKAAVKWLKERFDFVSGNADAFVLDRQHHAAALLFSGSEAQPSAVWHRAQSVGGQIPDDLLD